MQNDISYSVKRNLAQVIGKIKFVEGANIFQSDCKYLLNPVNCVGVMGAGLAKQFKANFPISSNHYINACRNQELKPGQILVSNREKGRIVIHVVTKSHWNNWSDLKDIASIMASLRSFADNLTEQATLCVPKIGCGCGGLDWCEVSKVIIKELANSNWNYIEVCGELHDCLKQIVDKR